MAEYEKKQKGSEEDRDERLAALVAQAVAQATVKVQERIAPLEKREASKVSVYNPTGGVRPKLNRTFIFAGAALSERFLTNDEIEALNTLPDNGQFHRGQWRLRTMERGDEKITFIDLPVKDVNQRMDLPRGVKAIVAEVHAEAAAK